MSKTSTLEWRNPKKLKDHPLNKKLYGDTIDQEFIDACEHGIDNPLLIDANDLVLSGHRRKRVAIIHGFEKLSVIVRRDLEDDMDKEEVLIRSNKQRERTLEEKGREYKRLKEIETARAQIREKAGKKVASDPTETVTEGLAKRTGEAGDIAAEAVGLSRPTAEKAVEAVHEIDAAEAAGDQETADDIRDTLNTKGAKPAAAKARDSKARRATGKTAPTDAPPDVLDHFKVPVPDDLREVFEQCEQFRKLMAAIVECKSTAKEIASTPAGGWLDIQEIERLLTDARSALRFGQPYTECPKCRRKPVKKCTCCKGTGWVHESMYKSASSDEDKLWITEGRT